MGFYCTMRMRIKPEVDFRFPPPTNSSVPSGSWWSVPNLVKIGEELRTLSCGTDTHTDGETHCAADIIIYHFFAILANVVDNKRVLGNYIHRMLNKAR